MLTMKWFRRRQYRQYVFDPQPDITAYELAVVLKMLKFPPANLDKVYEALPAECQRHFVVSPGEPLPESELAVPGYEQPKLARTRD